MEILSFSCLRPEPEHIGDVLGHTFTSNADISNYLKQKLVTLDISRALYLCAYSADSQTYTSLIACTKTEPNSAHAGSELGYQTAPVRVTYQSNMAIDIILSAATGAVPLYNVSNGSQQIVVWRISRTEAVEALQAAFASIEPLGLPATPYANTMVELVSSQNIAMPALPAGLFAHPCR